SNSFKLLLENNPKLVFRKPEIHSAKIWELSNRKMTWDSVIRCLVNDSMRKAMPFVVKERRFGEEMAITTLLSGDVEKLEHMEGGLDVYLHVGGYVPPAFGVRENAAHLAVVGRGRDFANAKYSDWVRLRKGLEKLRPPSVTELLLSNDGERILEGCLTNLFVVCRKEKYGDVNTIENNEMQNLSCIEVQTAPVSDGVLPGILRQVIIDICLKIGIPFREVAPSWSERELWAEAFITNSLRILQHVETIKAPSAWKSIESKTWEEITWVEKQFEDGSGKITSMLQVNKIALSFVPINICFFYFFLFERK
ncbi:hypothetical protein PHJA_002500600, partial [Phtheirospermum japonicum]